MQREENSMHEDPRLVALGRQRFRLAIALTAAMVVVYFGFILLVAFDKALLAGLLVPGLSLGMALGAAVIVAAWVLTFAYVRWANGPYDAAVDAIVAGAKR
jgi:uncharacterized membrane protein (DUF485 family)